MTFHQGCCRWAASGRACGPGKRRPFGGCPCSSQSRRGTWGLSGTRVSVGVATWAARPADVGGAAPDPREAVFDGSTRRYVGAARLDRPQAGRGAKNSSRSRAGVRRAGSAALGPDWVQSSARAAQDVGFAGPEDGADPPARPTTAGQVGCRGHQAVCPSHSVPDTRRGRPGGPARVDGPALCPEPLRYSMSGFPRTAPWVRATGRVRMYAPVRFRVPGEARLLASGATRWRTCPPFLFPLVEALFGRRSRRFALGDEIPDGPLAYRSRHEPVP